MFDVLTSVNVHPHPQGVKDRGEALPTRLGHVYGRSRARMSLREGRLAQTTAMTAQGKESQPAKATLPPRGRAAAKRRDAQVLDVLAGGPAGSELIAQRTKILRRTVQHRLLRLGEQGLVEESPRGTFRLSGAGQARVLAARQPALVSAPEPGALARLPAEHQALIRLISDAIVARRALAAVHTSNWPGFVILGPSKTGKTLIAQLVCRRFALDPTLHIHVLPRETSGSIWGRRTAEPGGGWRFEAAPLLAALFAALDEFDKATPEVQRAAHAYLQGDSEFPAEEWRAEVRATPLVLLNQDRGIELLPEPYLRRSVVLDTGQLLRATADIDEVARGVLGMRLTQVPEDLAPPETTFPEAARQLLRTVLQSCLTERGWRRADIESLSRIALGRWATNPGAGAERAAVGVAADYLVCTATRSGEVVDDWATRLEAVAATAPAAGADQVVDTARQRSASERELREAERRREEEAQAALAGKREELLARIAHALKSVPRSLRDEEVTRVAGARGRAKYRREQIHDARALDELARLEEIIEREVLTPLAETARARAIATDATAAGKRAAAEHRQAERERKKQIDAYVTALQARYLRSGAVFEPSVLKRTAGSSDALRPRVTSTRRKPCARGCAMSRAEWARRSHGSSGRRNRRLPHPIRSASCSRSSRSSSSRSWPASGSSAGRSRVRDEDLDLVRGPRGEALHGIRTAELGRSCCERGPEGCGARFRSNPQGATPPSGRVNEPALKLRECSPITREDEPPSSTVNRPLRSGLRGDEALRITPFRA